VLDRRVSSQIREHAEERLLSSIPSYAIPAVSTSSDSHPWAEARVRRYLTIIEATAYSIPESGAQQLGATLVERFNGILQAVEAEDETSKPASIDGSPILSSSEAHTTRIHLWITTLLRLTIIHQGTLQSGKNGSPDHARLCIALASLFIDGYIQRDLSLLEYVFDVATTLVDDLSDDARAQCARFLKDRGHDSRLRYFFGCQDEPSDWLNAVSRGKLIPYPLRAWEILAEPTPNVGENDTSLSLTSFQARRA